MLETTPVPVQQVHQQTADETDRHGRARLIPDLLLLPHTGQRTLVCEKAIFYTLL